MPAKLEIDITVPTGLSTGHLRKIYSWYIAKETFIWTTAIIRAGTFWQVEFNQAIEIKYFRGKISFLIKITA